jgi:putative oxidoreductase
MKKFLFSNSTTSAASSLGLLLLRLTFGLSMLIGHGWGKLSTFADKAGSFPDPLGVGNQNSMILAIFAEFFCAALVTLGLLTRAALIPLIVTMGVAAFVIHGSHPWFGGAPSKEMALLFLGAYTALLAAGPGKYSADHLIK